MSDNPTLDRICTEAVESIIGKDPALPTLEQYNHVYEGDLYRLMEAAYRKGCEDTRYFGSISQYMDNALIGEVKRRGLANVKQILLETIVMGEK